MFSRSYFQLVFAAFENTKTSVQKDHLTQTIQTRDMKRKPEGTSESKQNTRGTCSRPIHITATARKIVRCLAGPQFCRHRKYASRQRRTSRSLRDRARQQPKRMAHRHQQRQNRKNGSRKCALKASRPNRAGAVSSVSSRSNMAATSSSPSWQSIFPAINSSGIPRGKSIPGIWSVR
jgi:hypothetical protein